VSNPALDARGLPIGYPFREEWEVTPRQTKQELANDPAAVLLDCRRADELQLAAVKGAVHIPMDQIERRADELELDEARDRRVLVICHTGRRSLRVAATLRAIGFPNAYSVAGGIDLLSVDIDPAIPRY
jgi:rhodanese-related sulfurtransferase